ncbi:leucyl/phenylalanyl-tRNA--protein transferase [Streptomyces lunaelactis]|nr:leucyl/phenylalanyl-tRNA--protein transferase [Streptomyces lunaelactis]NUK14274.1 leucyl/phenylalanyl-tRNA--protein transferase [Streptomyces lunaelactis]NUK51223.1 leucyl/phenylalanyl-tRNA--protein transferase [Streptomyces lunaelactis]NUK58250.1 leucyl/phenylalanyl-tRNA--protein transferase [Streptomyces lunaelactis]NUK65433.1 leucyl/phenylalanyl-tRNA--protein transferase [Streptomyces lunaelactis]
MVTRCDSWRSLDLSSASAGGPVAFCADLSPETILEGYRAGLYPFPAQDAYACELNEALFEANVAAGSIAIVGSGERNPYEVAWWSPDPRPVAPPGGIHLGRSFARRLRNRLAWTTTVDRAFSHVLDECQRGRRPQWLTEELRQSLILLNEREWAHSVEVWEGDELIGGAYGMKTGAVFSLDSMFYRRSSASKVAIADLADRFGAVGVQLLDAQWDSPPVRAIGFAPVPREQFLAMLRSSPEVPSPPMEPLPARRLVTAPERLGAA